MERRKGQQGDKGEQKYQDGGHDGSSLDGKWKIRNRQRDRGAHSQTLWAPGSGYEPLRLPSSSLTSPSSSPWVKGLPGAILGTPYLIIDIHLDHNIL
jgi:hypothetical protein